MAKKRRNKNKKGSMLPLIAIGVGILLLTRTQKTVVVVPPKGPASTAQGGGENISRTPHRRLLPTYM